MLNPIKGNVFTWKDISFTIANDFSEVVVEKDGVEISIPSNALTDLKVVMDKEMFNKEESDDIHDRRLWNMTATSYSLPEADWS